MYWQISNFELLAAVGVDTQFGRKTPAQWVCSQTKANQVNQAG